MDLFAFESVRPAEEGAEDFACPPYDVVTRDDVARAIEEHSESFFRVTRSDAEFPQGSNPHAPEVYARALTNYRHFLDTGRLFREGEEALYVYRQTYVHNGVRSSQTGIVGCVSVADYKEGRVRVHEKTRPDKEEDRTQHMLHTGLHAEPVLLAYRHDANVAACLRAETSGEPLYDFEDVSGVRHALWRVQRVDAFVDSFQGLPEVYIADGHHRAASAKNCFERLQAEGVEQAGASDRFLAVLFPHTELRILAYNRIIKNLPCGPAEILQQLTDAFEVIDVDTGTPPMKGTFGLYLDDCWKLLRPRKIEETSSPVSGLDVSILSELVLRPIFNIENERTDKNIDFVGGSLGIEALEQMVKRGEAACAFSLYPVSMENLFSVADAGLQMPPKSTWFYPKLISGLFIHEFMKK